MNASTTYIGITIITISALFIISYNKKLLLIFFFLLLQTPWVYNLFLGKPDFFEYILAKPNNISIVRNLANLVSTDFLFFRNFPNLNYVVGDYGNFLPSFMPLIVMGFWFFLTSKRSKEKRMMFIFLSSLIINSFLFYLVGYLSALIFNAFLSILATFGFVKFVSVLKERKTKTFIKSLIILNLLLIIYESLRLFHSLNVQIHLRS